MEARAFPAWGKTGETSPLLDRIIDWVILSGSKGDPKNIRAPESTRVSRNVIWDHRGKKGASRRGEKRETAVKKKGKNLKPGFSPRGCETAGWGEEKGGLFLSYQPVEKRIKIDVGCLCKEGGKPSDLQQAIPLCLGGGEKGGPRQGGRRGKGTSDYGRKGDWTLKPDLSGGSTTG